MLEIERLRQDMLAQDERLARERASRERAMRREVWILPLAFVGGGAAGAAFLGTAAGFAWLFRHVSGCS